jgi:hypothetical protein
MLLEISVRKTQPIEHAGTFARPWPPSLRASLIDFEWPGKERSALRRGRDEQFFHSQGQADDDRDPREFRRSGSRSALRGGCFDITVPSAGKSKAVGRNIGGRSRFDWATSIHPLIDHYENKDKIISAL